MTSLENIDIELNPTVCKPRSQWRCLKPGYVEKLKEEAKNNPMFL